MGYCYEKGLAVMAELYSKGYQSQLMADLECKYTIGDKTSKHEIDHCFVIVNMNNKKTDSTKDIIVIDPWFGFVDTIRNAKTKYKNIYKKDIDMQKELVQQQFNIGDPDEIKEEIVFSPTFFTPEELISIVDYLPKTKSST